MKKYLSLLILCSLFNGAGAMEPVEKFYSIEAEDGEIVQFPKSLVYQCGFIKGMLDSLSDFEGVIIPISKPAVLLKSLLEFHNAFSDDAQKNLLEAKSVEGSVGLFKLADFLDYKFKAKITDGAVSKITTQETLKAILEGRISVDVFGAQESDIVHRLVDRAKPLISSYCLSRSGITLSGHTNDIRSVSVTPDSSKIITQSRAEVKIWDSKTGRCEHTLSDHTRSIYSVRLDGSKVIIRFGNAMKILDIYDPNLERALKYSSLKQALLCYYALINGEEATHALLASSVMCQELFEQCDPEIQAVIIAEYSSFGVLGKGPSIINRILTRRNALIGAGLLGTGVGLYAAYKWWLKRE